MHVSAVQGKEACTRTHWHIPSTTHTRTPSTRHTAWDKAQPRAADPGVPYRQCREHATRDVRRDGDDELPVRTKTRAWRSCLVTGGACARRRPPANRQGVRPQKRGQYRQVISTSTSTSEPPLCHLGVGCGYGRVMWGAASFLFCCARCSGAPVWVRGSRSSRRCPYRVAVPPEGGGAPPALGGRRAAPVAPQLRWVRGGGGRPPTRSRACVGGGGGVGGGLWSPGDASCLPGGWGGMAVLAPGARHRPGGRALPPPPLPRARFSRRPSLGPLIHRPLSRGAGRPGVAVRVSGQWLAGCGAVGSPPRSLSPHSLPREVAHPLASCRTVGGAWVGGPSPPPQLSRTRHLGLHLRRRLCGGWGCGDGGLCRR